MLMTKKEAQEISDRDKKKLAGTLHFLGLDKKNTAVKQVVLKEMGGDGLYLEGTSLGLFSEQNLFRRFLFRLVTHPRFDYFIIAIIVLSAVQLAMASPLADPQS